MQQQKLTIEAFLETPLGYERVKTGEILDNDMIWSWTTKEYLPANSSKWLLERECKMVEEAVYVVRKLQNN